MSHHKEMKINKSGCASKAFTIWLYLTLFILMDYSLHIETLSMELLILYFKGSQGEISKLGYIPVMKICFLSLQSVQTEMKYFIWVTLFAKVPVLIPVTRMKRVQWRVRLQRY